MTHRKILCLFAIVCLWISPNLWAQEAKTVRLLAVGNSFSEDATTYLPQIVQASPRPCTLILQKATIGGCDLERHMRHADLHEVDPNDPEGKPYQKKKKSLKDMLLAEKWDFVTIQQASPKSFHPETYRPHAKRLHDYIKKYAPTAEVVVHQTWAYRADEPRFGTAFCASQQEMHQKLCDAYTGIAKELGCRMIRSGDAVDRARRNPQWGGVFPDPNFDRKTAAYPALPEQSRSLHNGFSWKKENDQWKLRYDGTHLNPAGDFLAGCVWFEFFFETSVLDNTFVPDKLKPEDAVTLRRIAHE